MKADGLVSVLGISLLLIFCQLSEIDAKSKRHTSASWSAWSYGECSRSCGGGVQKATRICKNNRSDGRFHCDGPSSEHIPCNIQECPDRIDFRALQCAMYNKKPFKGHYYKWKPFYEEKNPCALVCAVNRTFHAQLADQVVDGTRCHPERYDICVDGKCKTAGCDRKLGSTLRDDACGVCGGEGKDCKTIKGHYTNETNNGYKDIITILKGATNIQIVEPTNTKNYFAVRNFLGKFYLNSQWKLVNHKKFVAAGTMFRYQKGPDGQLLVARGPTTDSLTFVLVGKGDPAQVHYEYYIPGKGHFSEHVERKRMRKPKRKYLPSESSPKARSSRQHEEPDKRVRIAKTFLIPSADTPLPSGDAPPRRSTVNYKWKHGVWTKCSASCGEGVQRRAVLCYNMDKRIPVEGKCVESEKPDDMKKCEMPCDASYYWVDGSWSECSKECGGGEMSLISICEHVTPAGRITVEDKYCEDTLGRSPTKMKVCNEHSCPETSVPREVPCWDSLYGCCSDRRTAASGPEQAGCPERRASCKETEYGCCPDGVNAARGPAYYGCRTGCQESDYGCCPDGVNAARGPDYYGCQSGCQATEYGCCPDGVNAARGPEYYGCRTGCQASEYGCCPDGVNAARGPNYYGCRTGCEASEYGCCPDGVNAARGPEYYGCRTGCQASEYGCCPDGVNAARGPDYYGCRTGCQQSEYGCCPDGVNAARGPEYYGCRTACQESEYGCCPDGVNTARGPEYYGCRTACQESEYGCCPDGVNAARGPDYYGCRTACQQSEYGCCPDGVNAARGERYAGCPSVPTRVLPESVPTVAVAKERQEVCSLPQEKGTCSDYKTRWSYDASSGNCVQFWYGGCGGNANRFETQQACHSTCKGERPRPTVISPTERTRERPRQRPRLTPTEVPRETPKEVPSTAESYPVTTGHRMCEMGKDTGTCTKYEAKWFYNTESKRCEQFWYGGCGGNDNRFDTDKACQEKCRRVSRPRERVSTCVSTPFGCCDDGVTAARGPQKLGCPEEDCRRSQFGCCPDGTTASRGQDHEGCPTRDCRVSRYGCCQDGVSFARGENYEGCRQMRCDESPYGCCPDGVSFAEGDNYGGCRVVPECERTEFGCCPDQQTTAQGPNGEGCCHYTEFGCCPDGLTISGPNHERCRTQDCRRSKYACCRDGVNFARGENFKGCPSTDCRTSEAGCCPDGVTFVSEGCTPPDCHSTSYGCCPDGQTIARGYYHEGCTDKDCRLSRYGCCPDGESYAKGEDYEGCPTCRETRFGCCPDGITVARGENYLGCALGSCHTSDYGCCPDMRTAASGPEHLGCKEKNCQQYRYGCCPDGVTYARGRDMDGCPPIVEGCASSKYGCCEDRRTAAQGPDRYGCPETRCDRSEFGCCEDGVTFARGPNYEGCERRRVGGCESTRFGCCEDRRTAAQGPERYGCPETRCDRSEFGCCEDGVNFARGPNYEGCERRRVGGCESTRFGCCEDRRTAAQGPERYGCPETRCDRSEFGCCEDGVNFARGPDYAGCERRRVGGCESTRFGCCEDRRTAAQGPERYGCPETRCDRSEFGCCEDGVTFARGPDYAGCRTRECSQSRFGCCPDGVSAARGENFAGCERDLGCEASVYGCCPDMVTAARGRDYEGCPPGGCRATRYGCCPDRITSAHGPNYAGCETRSGCESSLYGCCPDRVTEAKGPDYAGCAVPTPSGRADCELDKDPGPCDDQEIKWYFNVNSSKCERFWYGGCEGNNNKFDSSRECERKCLRRRASPTTAAPLDPCHLPYDEGTCSPSNAVRRWYYEPSSRSCQVFMYSGCDGNGNNFESEPVCMQRCFQPDYPGIFTSVEPSLSRNPLEICHLKLEAGNCSDGSIQWHYDNKDALCKNFTYSGCHGNGNRFPSKKACEEMCSPKAVCTLKEAYGTCSSDTERYRYDAERGQCVVFRYSGCNGNANNFVTLDACRNKCGVHVEPTTTTTTALPVETPKPTGLAACGLEKDESLCPDGIQRTRIAWYYDLTWAACQQFNYSGCGGNNNRFESAEVCTRTCNPQDICQMPKDSGICLAYSEFWYFNITTKTCEIFVYGGCGGNANRFATKNTCKKTCRAFMTKPTKEPTVGPGIHSGSKTADSCLLPQKPATCSLPVDENVWFYNMTEGICQHFQAGECSYNDNKFSTREECERTCDPRELCMLPRNPGTCYAYSNQYYFNPATKTCDQFVYGGCGGNANRFPTVGHCEKTCNALMNRDINTGPVRLPDDLKIAIMMCHLTPEKGPCRDNDRKWYYEVKEARCRQFTYGGCQGNNNRFETREACEQICNPQVICAFSRDAGNCTHFHRGYYFNSMVGRCEHLTYGDCYGNANRFYSFELCERTCSAASTPSTVTTIIPTPSVRPTAIAMCHLTPEKGPCRGAHQKWYYEVKEARCRQFTYGGCQGNSNRFETREECEQICNPQAICSLPKDAGNCTHFHRGYYFNSVVGRCEHLTYGDCYGNANRFYSGELCERTCSAAPRPTDTTTIIPTPSVNPTAISMCHLTPEKGPCRGADRKWYYEVKEARCRQFTYGGCQGNNNRFDTQEECEQICNPQAICSFPKDVGNCTPFHRGYYFNSVVGRCEHLTYGDCYGNANRFYTFELCERTCSAAPKPTDVTTPRPISPVKPTVDDCHLPKVTGSCRGRISAWYHDIVDNTCKQFYYGGCDGNGNRFQSKEECQKICNSYDICHLPEEGGLCFAYSEQFYFNHQTRRCEQFVYGGCGGNANRFASLEKCNNVCRNWIKELTTSLTPTVSKSSTRPVEFCHLEKEVGTCNSQLSTWYYDFADNTCKHFYYGGCGGNGNRFQTREECESICNPNDICNLRKDSGRCNARMIQYYFNPKTRNCEEFTYGGCDGNANRFPTISRCFAVCHSVIEQTTIQPLTEKPKVLDKPVDACHLGKIIGPCRAAKPSWHYDIADHDCKFFLYGGCQGNANNFKSKSECQHWCRPESICELPKDSGMCYAYSEQYYFNPSSQTCEQFVYGGCGGNANRFSSAAKCMDVCKSSMHMTTTAITTNTPIFNPGICLLPKETGKCYAYSEQYYFNPSTKHCEQFVYGGCEGNANRFPSAAECVNACKSFMEMTTTPIMTDIPIFHPAGACHLEKEVGPCRAQLPVWHYDTVDHECKLFYYGGCQGNANNFKTKQECHQTCNPYSICELPKESGKCYAYSEQYYFNPSTKRCEQFVYGGCGGNANRFPTADKCMELCKHLMPTGIPDTTPQPHANPVDACHLEKEVGPCRSRLPVWHYDTVDHECKLFYYGGCQGNANNFKTKQECQQTCNSYSICELPKESGKCYAYSEQYYFNPSTKRCEQFVYGGCGGNANRFPSADKCMDLCKHLMPTGIPDTTPQPHVNPELCQLPRESGPCFNYSEIYYFNQDSNRCEQFVYSGCGGNANRFSTLSECRTMCHSMEGTKTPVTKPAVTNTPKRNKDVCRLRKLIGPCSQNVTAWYFNEEYGVCIVFKYSGCGGNKNNFNTLKECEHVCQPTNDICNHPMTSKKCPSSQPFWVYDRLNKTCRFVPTGKCEDNPVQFSSEIDCKNQCAPQDEEAKDVCHFKMEEGPCRAYIRVWYYNTDEAICKPFIYGGCEGNKNRFDTKQKCDMVCNKHTICALKKDPGICYGYTDAYHYNAETNTCSHFVYGGCGGNANRFSSINHCQQVCGGHTPNTTHTTHPKEPGKCQLKPDSGSCQDRILSWYFDYQTGLCSRFYYTGCGGNENRFQTELDCQTSCKSFNPRTTMHTTFAPVTDNSLVENPQNRFVKIHVVPKETLKLHCGELIDSTGAANPVIWTHDGQDIIPGPRRQTEDLNLIIYDVQSKDAGMYTCRERSNTVTPTLDKFKVIIKVPVTIDHGPSHLSALPNHKLIIPCQAHGVPKPLINWYKDGNEIHNDNHFHIFENGTLLVDPFTINDVATYKCLARNGYEGEAEKEVKVTIQDSLNLEIKKSSPTMHVGDKITLTCIADGYPNTRLQWFFKDREIYSDHHITVRNGVLTIKNATYDNSGVYTCRGTHAGDQVNKDVILRILSMPDEVPQVCEDRLPINRCRMIVAAKLCKRRTFHKNCCVSCTRSATSRR